MVIRDVEQLNGSAFPELEVCDRMVIQDVTLQIGGSTACDRRRLGDATDAVFAMMRVDERGDLLGLWRESTLSPAITTTSLMGDITVDLINNVIVSVDGCETVIGSCNLGGLLVRIHPNALRLPFWELRNLVAHELGHAMQFAREEEATEEGADRYAVRWSNPLSRPTIEVAA